MSEPCGGCRIEPSYCGMETSYGRIKQVKRPAYIIYCPKHQAVDQLLEAAKKFIGWLDYTKMTSMVVEPTRVKAMREAITAAEEKP